MFIVFHTTKVLENVTEMVMKKILNIAAQKKIHAMKVKVIVT